MDDYLTTRQVQDFLKVDRITVYRMLTDGRLKGVKIGQQWRFTRREVERLISGETRETDPAATEARGGDASAVALPLHCIQTIQNLFSDVARLNALVVGLNGDLLTRPSRLYDGCPQIQQDPDGCAACQQEWLGFLQASQGGQRLFTGENGARYAGEPILDGDEVIGLFLVGPYRLESDAPAAASSLALPTISPSRLAEVESWPATAVRAIQSVLCERSGFLSRLQQIANLTQIS